MPSKKSVKTIYYHAFIKGREFGYMEALSDMIDKEETVLMSTESNILEIRKLKKTGTRTSQLANQFRISTSQVRRIINITHWSHI